MEKRKSKKPKRNGLTQLERAQLAEVFGGSEPGPLPESGTGTMWTGTTGGDTTVGVYHTGTADYYFGTSSGGGVIQMHGISGLDYSGSSGGLDISGTSDDSADPASASPTNPASSPDDDECSCGVGADPGGDDDDPEGGSCAPDDDDDPEGGNGDNKEEDGDTSSSPDDNGCTLDDDPEGGDGDPEGSS
jgi:hypothetical protein